MFWTQVFSWVCARITMERSRLVEEAGRGGVRCRALGQSWAVLLAGRTWAGKCGGGGVGRRHSPDRVWGLHSVRLSGQS